MSRPHVVSPAELSSLRDLELLARTTVEGLRQGLHRSPFHGYSAEFSQYRHYRPGDDLKYVDWKAFGRTDRLYSRQFRETTNMSALFVLDVSRSMDFPASSLTRAGLRSQDAGKSGVAASKFTLARAAAAVLATLVIDQGDAAGLLAINDERSGTHYVPARSGRHHLHICLAELARLQCDSTATVAVALQRAATLLRRRGMVVVISDMYEDAAVMSEVRRLSRMGHDVVVIQVIAREELTLPRHGAVEFEDLETGATLATNGAAVAVQYARNIADFLVHVEQTVTREGLDYLRLTTGESLESALRRFLVGRRGGE
jgi:uncharacterized protein (DUF58 family)